MKRKHTKAECDGRCGTPYGCNVCNLFICTVCDGAEGSLPTECPGMRMSYELGEAVYAEAIDFKDGRWQLTEQSRTAIAEQP